MTSSAALLQHSWSCLLPIPLAFVTLQVPTFTWISHLAESKPFCKELEIFLLKTIPNNFASLRCCLAVHLPFPDTSDSSDPNTGLSSKRF